MLLQQFFAEYGTITLLLLAVLAFVAGFIDAVIGGGGLIQLPALLISFPKMPLPVIFGTTKIASLAGTSLAAYHYSRKIHFNYRLLVPISLCAAAASFAGARLVMHIDVQALKPVILVILIVIAIYTYLKKDLGTVPARNMKYRQELMWGCLLAVVIGFYDGFFGPGTGSFFVLGFVVLLGFEFLQASAYSKFINCVTNLSALVVFVSRGQYILPIALLMAACNMAGNFAGTHVALKKGNGFVRIFFLIIVMLMIARYAYDVFYGT
ncbi:MAG: sulfite exporter TauE/SafE family protein [Chitinophagaceae bacterium]|nr:MAG: sulfite exporter TauE/SafE family protein [Chitinophagaceae bacterium]